MNRTFKYIVGVVTILILALKLSVAEEMNTKDRFVHQAQRWESWCELHRFDSNFKVFADHDSVRALRGMDKSIIPLIFERWKQLPTDSPDPPQPPWWIVLEHLTGKKLVSNEEKLEGLPADIRETIKPESVEVPELQEKRWRIWWAREGKKQFLK